MRADSSTLFWTKERIALLKQLAAEGASARAIATRLGGVSRAAVLGKIFRLRLRRSARKKRPGVRPSAAGAPRTPAPKRGLSLLELTNHTCRWPHGRPGSERFHFCGAPGADLEAGMPYCAVHARRAYPHDARIDASPLPAARERGCGEAVRVAAPARPFVRGAGFRHPAMRRR